MSSMVPYSVSTDKWTKPGDIVIETIELTSCSGFTMNIREQLASVVIYEDLFSNSLSGFVTLIDALNLSKHMPIIGNETLKIVFTTPGIQDQPRKKITLSLKVYKVSSRQKVGGSQNQVLVSLEFVGEEFFFNAGTKISKSYSSQPYSDMVKNIFYDYIVPNNEINASPNTENGNSKLVVFETYGMKNIVLPNWSPFYAINFLASRSSYSGNNQMCDYVFYQNLEGRYLFLPLSYMKSLPVSASYKHVPADHDSTKQMADNAKSVVITNFGDKMRDFSTGTYGSLLTTFDTTYKKIEYDIYSYRQKFEDQIHVSKHPTLPRLNETFSDKILSHRKFLPKHSYKWNEIEDNEKYLDFSLNRHSLMNQIGSVGMEIDAPGDSRRRVGDIVQVDIVSQEDTAKKNEWRDTYLSGRYMITRIAHNIGRNEYNMILTLTKDSFDDPIPDYKEANLNPV
jgi:hypothetical protein